jgi:hypothetical protein
MDHETLMQLQVSNRILAAKGQQNLAEAEQKYQVLQASDEKKRLILLSVIQAVRKSELAHEKNVCRLIDRFHYNMKEAYKLDSDAKSAAQLKAIAHSEAFQRRFLPRNPRASIA